jgi:hypothetical protein
MKYILLCMWVPQGGCVRSPEPKHAKAFTAPASGTQLVQHKAGVSDIRMSFGNHNSSR